MNQLARVTLPKGEPFVGVILGETTQGYFVTPNPDQRLLPEWFPAGWVQPDHDGKLALILAAQWNTQTDSTGRAEAVALTREGFYTNQG